MLKIPDSLLLVFLHRSHAVFDYPLPPQLLHHTVDRVVLQVGDDEMVPRLRQSLDDDIERFGAVFGEHHLLGLTAEQGSYPLAATVDHPAGLHRKVVTSSARIGSIVQHRLLHRLHHTARLREGGGSVVKIDHRPSPAFG